MSDEEASTPGFEVCCGVAISGVLVMSWDPDLHRWGSPELYPQNLWFLGWLWDKTWWRFRVNRSPQRILLGPW